MFVFYFLCPFYELYLQQITIFLSKETNTESE